MATAVTLKESDGSEIYPVTDISLVNNGIHAVDIEATTPVPAVETAMIADGAVTGEKLSSTAVARTVTDNLGRSAIYFQDGTMITTRKVQITININTTVWTNFYRGITPDYYIFMPDGGSDFVAEPCVNVTVFNNGTSGSCLVGPWEKSVQKISGGGSERWGIPSGALCFVRPTAATGVVLNLYIQAIGRWKA